MKIPKLILIFIILNISFLSAQEPTIEEATNGVEVVEEKTELNDVMKIAKNIQVSAYFQGQFQVGQKDVRRMMVGAENENYGEKSFNRFGLRRAFISTMYEQGLVYALFTLEAKDNKGVWFSDAFINITDPWTKRFDLSLGAMNPDFGYELSISPSKYELVEGTWFIYSLLPDIYDVGAKLNYKPALKSGFLRMSASLVGGNGVQRETDSRKDFVGSIWGSTNEKKQAVLSGGFSYYNGSVYQGTENVYKMKGQEFELNNALSNKGKYAKREYFDFNAQVAVQTGIGLSQLRGEYIFGTQPGAQSSYDSPNSKDRPTHDTYIRKFNGGYVYYLQQIGPKLPLTFWGGYSWHDPNTDVSGDEVGKYNTNTADIKYQTISLGLIWYLVSSIRLQAFYEMPINEKSVNLANLGYDKHRKENVFTLRLQYKY